MLEVRGSRRTSALLLSLCLSGCDEKATGDVAIAVDIATELTGEVRVVSARGMKPGTKNPVEVAVVLANDGAVQRRVDVVGAWSDDRGGTFGRVRSTHVIAPGATVIAQAATRTADVTRFVATVAVSMTTPRQQVDAALTAAAQSGVEGHGIAYTATPTLDVVPKWPPRGVANGAPFEVGTIVFMPLFGKWNLHLHDREFDPVNGGEAIARSNHPDLQSIYLHLPEEPSAGAVFEKPLSAGDGYFQIRTAPRASTTTSWNSDIAWVIEITKWDRAPWRADGPVMQTAGTASGRLYVCFKGSDLSPLKSSFVSGEFEDAPIVYSGEAK